MSRRIADGELRIWYVAAIASPASPTAVEVTAGVDLTPNLIDVDTPFGGNTADAADVSSAFNKTTAGTYGGQALTANFHRDSVTGSDLPYTTLPRNTSGYIVIRRFGGASVAATAAQKVEVWPILVTTRAPVKTNRNETQRFMVEAAITNDPNLDVALT